MCTIFEYSGFKNKAAAQTAGEEKYGAIPLSCACVIPAVNMVPKRPNWEKLKKHSSITKENVDVNQENYIQRV